jgi:hypothetical protein
MKKKFIVPYQYTIIGKAVVYAETLEQALENMEHGAPCPEPQPQTFPNDVHEINSVKYSYLDDSFEIHHDDLDLYNN